MSFTFSTKQVPLHEQVASPQYRTPEHETTYPVTMIAERVELAALVAKRAATLAKESYGTLTLEEALEEARNYYND